MKTKTLAVVASIVLVAGGCGRQSAPSGGAAADATAGSVAALSGPAAQAFVPGGSPLGGRAIAGERTGLSRAAALPDRGELVAYPGKVVRTTGAYTWHRAAISEAHALAAVASGRLRLTTPDGRLLDIVYDRRVRHDSGDWTWIGHLAGHEGVQTVLTIGAEAVFGSIGQDVGLPLRVTMRDGVSWLVETDAAQVALIDSEATRPSRPDFHVPVQPRAATRGTTSGVVAAGAAATATANATAGSTVDLLVGYTPGLRAAYGSASAVNTRINNLVDLTNTAYVNGGVDSRVRLVHTMEVNYTDDNGNQTALEAMSGYQAGVGPITPDPAFTALRSARDQYGADLVSLVRDFRDPEHDGCGIAWLLGGSLQGISEGEGWDTLGYSVVSDGVDLNEEDNKTYFCRETTFAHELGHNMGAAHDKETAKGSNGTLDNPDDYGAYTYSFGYKSAVANLYTIMAYGDSGQTGYTIFSTPLGTFCGGVACGGADTDNVRTLDNTMPVVAGFRATVVVDPVRVRADFNGDGESDVLWRNGKDGSNTIWLSATQGTKQAVDAVEDQDWRVVAIGDFDGDAVADVYWRNQSSGANTIWRSGNAATRLSTQNLGNTDWFVAGAADFDGDGEDDILWRNGTSGANTIWHSGNQANRESLVAVTDTRWQVVAVGDFDGDGEADVFWRHSGTGKNTVWYSAQQSQRQTLRRVGVDWQVVAAGDFDGDGNEDIFWRNVDDGRNTIWRSANGDTKQAVTRVAGAGWHVEAVGDYDGDGLADVFWRDAATGDNVLWPAALRSERIVLPSVSLRWDIVP